MLFLGEGGKVGCFTSKDVSLGESKGARIEFIYDADYSQSEGAVLPAKSRVNNGVVITAISTSDQEAVSHLACFGDKIYTYAFGRQAGNVTVNCMVFLGGRSDSEEEGSQGGNYLKQLFDLYRYNRISQSLSTVRVVFPGSGANGGVAIRGNLVGLSTNTKDPDVGMQNAQLTLVTTEAIGADQ